LPKLRSLPDSVPYFVTAKRSPQLPQGLPRYRWKPCRPRCREGRHPSQIHRRLNALGHPFAEAGAATIDGIAAREAYSKRHVNMTISLAFLAPSLVKAAVEGRLPPVGWSRQHQMLGLAYSPLWTTVVGSTI
jgi:site-specific DNA recombinase